ncbi:hypothetical protein [Sphingomonas sp. SUN039]|uniref:hypothetical protein n=1 Tax=Sphingomonas sp. SUN039 TaxID=2937787 RepID=UPI002164CBE3|nr:hypothetical protein [Sphingomonas sp. SUN039]UVO54681.1 hypothetical protein M0209_11315 [Sphingomonas sp. SUN039]
MRRIGYGAGYTDALAAADRVSKDRAGFHAKARRRRKGAKADLSTGNVREAAILIALSVCDINAR